MFEIIPSRGRAKAQPNQPVAAHGAVKATAACASGAHFGAVCALVVAACAFDASAAGVVIETLHSFSGSDGASPRAGLTEGDDGYLYGTTSGGGTNGGTGTVFQISPSGTFTSLHSFAGGAEGAAPYAAIVEVSDGNLYGTTSEGGTYDSGTVFRITSEGILTTICPSIGYNGGALPGAWLALGSDGFLYATTVEGGTHYVGSVCKITTNGATTTLHSFDGTDGHNPKAAPVQGSDGYIYGTTYTGGTNDGLGVIFRISTNGAFQSLHSMATNEGEYLEGALVQGRDGYLYGTAAGGGSSGAGTVFKISTNGTLTALYSFMGGNSGAGPDGALTLASDGYFYGVSGGGAYGAGTLFRISTDGALTTLYTFSGGSDGSGPEGGLVQGSDGSFYGTTAYGGQGGAGTVFRLTILPEFQSETLTNGSLNLTWSTEAGGTYQLQYTSDVTSSNWTNLGGATVATGSSLTGTDFVTNNAQRFYRVVLAP